MSTAGDFDHSPRAGEPIRLGPVHFVLALIVTLGAVGTSIYVWRAQRVNVASVVGCYAFTREDGRPPGIFPALYPTAPERAFLTDEVVREESRPGRVVLRVKVDGPVHVRRAADTLGFSGPSWVAAPSGMVRLGRSNGFGGLILELELMRGDLVGEIRYPSDMVGEPEARYSVYGRRVPCLRGG